MSKTLNDTGHKSFHSYIQGWLDKVNRPTDILCPFSFNNERNASKLWLLVVKNRNIIQKQWPRIFSLFFKKCFYVYWRQKKYL